MSQEVVNKIILKALADTEFREQLFANPQAALTGYDLTVEEHSGLSSLPRESLDVLALDVEQRISKSIFLFHPGSPRHPMNPQPEPPAIKE
jgi:hypothetical protein